MLTLGVLHPRKSCSPVHARLLGHSDSLSSNMDGSGFPASPWLKDPMLMVLNWLCASCNKKEAIRQT